MMKNLIYTLVLTSLCALSLNAQFAEPAVTGANFVPNQTEVGLSSTLTISFANSGASMIPSGSIELTIATAYTYYTTDKVTPPGGNAGAMFNWTLISEENDIWRGTNNTDIPAFGGGDITVQVTGINVSSTFETTNINVQPVNSFTSFNDAASNNNLQPQLKIDPSSCSLGSTAPTLSTQNVFNSCPITIVDLDVLHTSSEPSGSSLVWSTDGNPSDGISTTINPIVGNSGVYYAYYYHSSEDCYSPSSAAVNVTIDNICNEPPLASNDTEETFQNTEVIVNVLSNDSDPNSDNLSVEVLGSSTQGVVPTILSDQSVSYNPPQGYIGLDSFAYRICDGSIPNMCDTAIVYIQVEEFIVITNVCPDKEIHLDSIFDGSLSAGITIVWSSDSDGSDGLDDVLPTSLQSSDTVYVYYLDTLAECYSIGTPLILEFTGCNRAPIAINDVVTTETDVSVSGQVLTNDDDPDGDSLLVSLIPTSVTGGSVNLLPDGSYFFTPDPTFSGEASFVYEVCDEVSPADGPSKCDTAKVVINVIDNNNPNNPPVGIEDNFVMENDNPLNVNILSNDIDPEDDDVAINTTPITNPDHGSLTINGDGTIDYDPDPSYVGQVSFKYEVCDVNPAFGGPSLCDTVEVIIEILDADGKNDIYATDDASVGERNMFQMGSVSDNDNDPEGDEITVSLIESTSYGDVEIDEAGMYTYVPHPDFVGNDFFTYEICDDGIPQACDTATMSITVLHPVVKIIAADDDVNAFSGLPLDIDIMINDEVSNSEFDLTSIQVIVDPTNGSVEVREDGTIDYTSSPDYLGGDSFTYVVCDVSQSPHTVCDTATVTIDVVPLEIITNVCPVERVYLDEIHDDTIPEGIVLVWSTDSDPDDGLDNELGEYISESDTVFIYYQDTTAACYSPARPVRVNIESCEYAPQVMPNPITVLVDHIGEMCSTINDYNLDDTHTASLCETPENGIASTSILNGQLCVQYSPDNGYSGHDEVCVIICDNTGLCDTIRIPVTVIDPLEPSVTPEPPTVIVTPIVVTENDTADVCSVVLDPNEGETHTVSVCTGSPESGDVVASIEDGNICLEYAPDAEFTGEDEICLIVCDNTGLCDTVSIPVTVVPVIEPLDSMNPPVVIVPAIVVSEDSVISFCVPFIDTNEGDSHTVSQCGHPANGTANIVLNNSDDEICITYEPNEDFSGVDEICLIVCDNTGLCDSVIVPIQVIDAPSELDAQDDGVVNVSGTLPDTIYILSNDKDREGNVATVNNVSDPEIVDEPTQGTVTTLPNGTIVYAAEPGATGVDSFTYRICDAVDPNICDTAVVYLFNNSIECDIPDPGCAVASDVIGEVGDQASFRLKDHTGENVKWHIASPHAVPNAGTGDSTGFVTFTQAGEYTVVFTIENESSPEGCSTPATVFATTRYYVENPITECAAPTDSPVDVEPSTTAIFKGEDASFDLVDGQPYTDIQWTITPTSGVSTIAGVNAATGPITFDSSGVYLIEYSYTNHGDGNCEPVSGSAKAYLSVGLSPCSAPSALLLTSSPHDAAGEYATGEEVTFTALGGTPGDMTWRIVSSSNFEVATGTGNTVTHTFEFEGEYFVVFSSVNNNAPSSCTQIVGNSETKKVIITNEYPPLVQEPQIEVVEGDTANVCVSIQDANIDNTHTVTTCKNPSNGGLTASIDNERNELCLQYIPNPEFYGLDTICLVVCDNTGLCDTIETVIIVTKASTLLDAVDDGIIVINGLASDTIQVLENDSDVDGNQANLTTVTSPEIIGDPEKGTINRLTDGSLVYTPNMGVQGLDTFSYVICDLLDAEECDTAIVVLSNLPVECDQAEPGVAKASAISGETGAQANFTLENYYGDEVTWSIASPHAVPNSGTGDQTGDITFVEAGEYVVVFTITSNSNPEHCSVPSTVFATTRYLAKNPIQECEEPTYSPVEVSPAGLAIFQGGTASFTLTDGQPYTSLTWTIIPSTGVSDTLGFEAHTGPITFDNDGVYMIRYNYVNIGDGSCEPTEATATGYVNVGTNPCISPSPILIECDPAPADEVIPTGENVTFTAGGGVPGVMTWEILNEVNVVIRSGDGNTLDHTFISPGDYYITFHSTNTNAPQGCTQSAGTSETKKVVVENRNAPEVDINIIQVQEEDSVTICAPIMDPNIDDIHSYTRCGGPINGIADITIDNDNNTLCIMYEPNENFIGSDEMCIIVCDQHGMCDTLEIPIEVTAIPRFINAEDDKTFILNGLDADTIDILYNDTSNETTTADVTNINGPRVIGLPSHGNVEITSDGQLVYQPQVGAFGLDTVTYEICDISNPTVCDSAIVVFLNIPIKCREAQPGVAVSSDISGTPGESASFVLEDYVGDEVSWSIASDNAIPNNGEGDSTGDVYFLQPGIYTVIFEIQSHSTPDECSVPSTVFATTRYIVNTPGCQNVRLRHTLQWT